jgi:uncharacterized protein (TIGR03066 family)
MKWMHAAVLGFLVVGLVGCGDTKSTKDTHKDSKTVHTDTGGTSGGDGAGKPPSNKDKILGAWEVAKSEQVPKGSSLEFLKDGKVTMIVKEGKTETKMGGTYTVEGDKVTIITKGRDGKEHKDPATIVKLTDTELVTRDDKGKTDEYKKK